MKARGKTLGPGLGCSALALFAAMPMFAAGFSIFQQGSKAMAMGGAFTAQADDPSAMFFNVGGLAFLDEQEFQVGFTFITQSEADFEGANPFPGEGTSEELETLAETPPHFYWVKPLGERWNFGLAVNSPFGLVVEWQNKSSFTGRFISTRTEIVVFDINPNLGWKISDTLGIGFGPILRVSEVELNRRAAAINPFTLQPVDVASVVLESDLDTGFGWQAGFLHKLNNSFSWGFSYRSSIEVDFGGDARLTQILTGNPQFDGLVALSQPFGRELPIETSIEFPDAASLGVAVAISPRLLIEVDANWTGWSSFDAVVIDFTNDDLEDQVLPQEWDDTNHYRLGLRWTRGRRSEWRLGYVFDETPQPDTGVGPLLPDSDRNGFSVGYGHQGQKVNWDLALLYLPFNDRSTRTNRDDFNGSSEITAWLIGFTVGW
ncbi:MAG: outer membrane protein transport protein [Thermoanaerobaculia bacterium]